MRVQNAMQYTADYKINVNSILQLNMTNLQDDWVGIVLANSSMPDPLINLSFKTELITHLKTLNSKIQVKVGPTLEYQKSQVKCILLNAK